ncbi:hypothetical protein ACFL96_16100 [Thermoproteota archaeon]
MGDPILLKREDKTDKLRQNKFYISGVVLSLFLLSFFCVDAFAFKFEEFEWGRPQDEVKRFVEINKGKTIIDYGEGRFFKYSDQILDEECRVICEFTPKTSVLASIKITWKDKKVGEDVKNLLVDKYGDFYQPNVFIEEYYWYGDSQYDAIVLEYDYAGTTLTYFGGRNQEKYEKEYQELVGKEKQRF